VSYNYDDLNRLDKATGGNLSQTYAYDRYGNIEISGAPNSWIPPYGTGYAATNRYVTGGACNGTGICYDADGNLLSDTTHAYTWNAENKLLAIDGGTAIVYDAFNRPVEKQDGRQYIYVPALESAFLQMSGQTIVNAVVPLPGGGSAVYNSYGLSDYQHVDWNGASRVLSTQAQTLFSQTEYTPFGVPFDESRSNAWLLFDYAATTGISGEYDTPNRQLFAGQGRWIQPDPAGLAAVDVTNPQSWNRYAYVMNNPVSVSDPSGLLPGYGGGCNSDAMNCYGGAGVGDMGGGIGVGLCPADNEGCSGMTFEQAAKWGTLDARIAFSAGLGGSPVEPLTFVAGVIGGGITDDAMWTFLVDVYEQLGRPHVTAQEQSTAANNIPFSASVYLPVGYGVGGYTYTYTHIAAKGQPTYNCNSHSGTISTPAAKAAVSGGPLTLFGQSTQNAQNVISSWGWNFSLQALPWLGYQVNINSSGVVGGFTFGVPGASASYGWGSCTRGD